MEPPSSVPGAAQIRDGRQALASRVIAEAGARAVDDEVARILHPGRSGVDVADRLPAGLPRRAYGRISRSVVDRAGGLLLRLRRVPNRRLVEAVHELARARDEDRRRITRLEAELDELRRRP